MLLGHRIEAEGRLDGGVLESDPSRYRLTREEVQTEPIAVDDVCSLTAAVFREGRPVILAPGEEYRREQYPVEDRYTGVSEVEPGSAADEAGIDRSYKDHVLRQAAFRGVNPQDLAAVADGRHRHLHHAVEAPVVAFPEAAVGAVSALLLQNVGEDLQRHRVLVDQRPRDMAEHRDHSPSSASRSRNGP